MKSTSNKAAKKSIVTFNQLFNCFDFGTAHQSKSKQSDRLAAIWF